MQIHRMFEIVYLLMHKKTVTAKELADHFEVSPRTVYRDIDTLCEAGIPVYTLKGKGGGIRLLDNFVLNKSMLSEQEQEEILASLSGLNAVTGEMEQVLAKLSGFFNKKMPSWIEVDLSQWGEAHSDYYQLLRTAILQRWVIRFAYFNSSSELSIRTVEPLQLWFKHKTWYVKGYCQQKQAMRLFKLTRMRHIELLEEHFERELPPSSHEYPAHQASTAQLVLRIDASQAYRIYDEFDESQHSRDEDGNFVVTVRFPEDEWVYGFILSFGHYAEVLEPLHIRHIIRERLQLTTAKYL
ncbi:helix-turn-helix transcriptional regulator [Paenibacillus guangzhouensis]|uniref:helix-turn-helix transcriptional regulator n=1 Tax=Paenibacillus guangzhouensis TaxID=1473112 RepID=UPI0012677897|nr:YafY family protein [Paenibacillus guangzhouensis]